MPEAGTTETRTVRYEFRESYEAHAGDVMNPRMFNRSGGSLEDHRDEWGHPSYLFSRWKNVNSRLDTVQAETREQAIARVARIVAGQGATAETAVLRSDRGAVQVREIVDVQTVTETPGFSRKVTEHTEEIIWSFTRTFEQFCQYRDYMADRQAISDQDQMRRYAEFQAEQEAQAEEIGRIYEQQVADGPESVKRAWESGNRLERMAAALHNMVKR